MKESPRIRLNFERNLDLWPNRGGVLDIVDFTCCLEERDFQLITNGSTGSIGKRDYPCGFARERD
jgi:hypothetical protein